MPRGKGRRASPEKAPMDPPDARRGSVRPEPGSSGRALGQAGPPPTGSRRSSWSRTLSITGICAALILATLAAYWGLRSNGFIWQDDGQYVAENAHVQMGLTRQSAVWAFTTTHAANWHPVTWLSHMLDVQLFGLDAGKHHSTSLLLHALNAALLFLLLFRMTSALWRSAFVAALFALHPVHVESVAWIAERKDVLSTLFWLLTMGAWLGFVRSRKPAWYLLAVLLYALGLMSKPMLVTLPFTLLLLDYWPLRRLTFPWRRDAGKLKALLWEKAPLFAMSAASCVITAIAQQGAMPNLAQLPLAERTANALQAYVGYLGKTFWPSALAIFYPYPHTGLFTWSTGAALLLLAGVTLLSLRLSGKAPYLLFGWLWCMGTLVPVIGLVQVGDQSMADRYTYVPLFGIFIAVAWGLAELVKESAALRRAAAAAAAGVLAALLAVTRIQTTYWVDTEALFGHALEVTSDNWLAHDFLGLSLALSGKGKMQEAISHFTDALKIDPKHPDIHNNLAMALRETGRLEEAAAHYREALKLIPDAPVPLKNLGLTLLKMDRIPEAVECLARVARVNPDAADSHLYYGQALDRAGRVPEALEQFDTASRLEPRSAQVLIQMGKALGKMNRLGEAIACLEKAVMFDPNSVDARVNLGMALDLAGRTPEALAQFEAALRAHPDSVEALYNKGAALGKLDRPGEAIACLEKAVALDPRHAKARFNLGVALNHAGRVPEALEQFREVLRLRPDDAHARAAMETVQRTLRERR